MRLIKYIGNLRMIVVYAILTLAYAALNLSVGTSMYSFFQHPYLTVLVFFCFFFLIFRFDFKNVMLTSRFESGDSFLMKCGGMLIRFAAVYTALLTVIIVLVGLLMGDNVSWKRLAIYWICTFLSLCVFSVMYVILSNKIGGMAAKIWMYSYVVATIALGFVGHFFIDIDFAYFNINTDVTPTSLLRMTCVYVVTTVFLYLLTLFRGSEKT